MIGRLPFIVGGIAVGLLVAPNQLPRIHVLSYAFAQAGGMAGIAQTETVSARATVKSLDLQTRHVTLEEADGHIIALTAGPEVRNLAQVRVGDTVVVHFHTSTAFVLAPPGTKLPENSLTVGAARAAPGERPGAAASTRMVVTGLVVAVDPTLHTLSLVDPKGGPVRSINVVTPQGQQSMRHIKIGDTITAIITDAVLVAVEPAA
jgi:Cu/Ag efflux protein CusF